MSEVVKDTRNIPLRSSPYQGLIPFDQDDAAFFFGREKDTRLIAANMYSSPLTLLYGASGVGKSSVLRAGVMNHLCKREDLFAVLHNSWQDDPVKELKTLILKTLKKLGKDFTKAKMPRAFNDFLEKSAKIAGRRLMIVLDQFEEYFLYHPDAKDKFVDNLASAISPSQEFVSFLISIREDSLAKLDRFEGSIPILFDNYLRVDYLDYSSAREAIVKPIVKFNEIYSTHFEIEAKLINTVLEQVQTGNVILGEAEGKVVNTNRGNRGSIETPFLQLVMNRLWNEYRNSYSDNKLQLRTLIDLGGANRIVQTHLDVVLEGFSGEERESIAQIFNLLVTPSGTKIAHSSKDLARYINTPDHKLEGLLKKLSSGDIRILRTVTSNLNNKEQRYEIYHDVLAQAVLAWRRKYLEQTEKADDKKTIEELENALQLNEEKQFQTGSERRKPTVFPLGKLMTPLEKFAVKKFLSQRQIIPEDIWHEIKFDYKHLDSDNIMDRIITFDAFWSQGNLESFFEVVTSRPLQNSLLDKIYVMLTKINKYRQFKSVSTSLQLILLELPEELISSKYKIRDLDSKLKKAFNPAIERELLHIDVVSISIAEFEEVREIWLTRR